MSPARKEPDVSTYSGRFALKLKKRRESMKITVPEIVEALQLRGVKLGLSTYYNWEASRTDPPFDVLPDLAAVLGYVGVRGLMP
jgi:transcriptional regulator with XRE-family HTH domain